MTNPNQNHWQPTLADGLREWRCARVCFGTYHAAARTVDGSVLTWGRQFECCLGRKSVMDDHIGEPGIVEELPRAAFLRCVFVTFGQVLLRRYLVLLWLRCCAVICTPLQ